MRDEDDKYMCIAKQIASEIVRRAKANNPAATLSDVLSAAIVNAVVSMLMVECLLKRTNETES